jgi:polar amino acid transport system substrate-binding protein
VLNVGINARRAPISFIDSQCNIIGFSAELAYRIGGLIGRRVALVDMEFASLISALEGGKIDAIVDYMAITEERKKQVSFSDPFLTTGSVPIRLKTTILTGLPGGDKDSTPKVTNDDFNGKTIAVQTGTIYGELVEKQVPNAVAQYYNDVTGMLAALQSGKVDALITDEPLVRKMVALNGDLAMVLPSLSDDEYGIMVSKEKLALLKELDDFYDASVADGSYADMIKRWVDSADTPPMPDIETDGQNGVLRVATDGATDPFSFIADNGKPVGFSIEYTLRFAKARGYKVEFQVMEFGGLLSSVASGKADIAVTSISITPERAKSVNFTKPYYIGGAVFAYRKAAAAALTGAAPGPTQAEPQAKPSPGFFAGFADSFYSNLILENRWKLIVNGLGVTILISLFALLFGTILAFGVCGLNMSRNKALNAVGRVYITILRGTPVLVLLMITFYIIFAKSNISGVMVAIFAFSLNEAAFIGEIIRGAILQVDKGQVEAARSLGYSNAGSFFLVTLPQAARNALPVYKNEFIGWVKSTSVVGYIAIQDVTRAGDIIRSRTYDAFFPLLTVAVMYLITTGVFIWLFDQIAKATKATDT